MRLVLSGLLVSLISGCAGLRLAEETDGLPDSVNLESVPFHPQTKFHCGPAALATVLEDSGREVSVDELADRVYTPGLKGSLQAEMVATARSHGRLVYRLPGKPRAVLAEVAAGRPVLVLENHGLASRPYWHYAVVVGYDRHDNSLLLRSGTEHEQRQDAGRWLRLWDRAGRWSVVLITPGEWPTQPDRDRWMSAAVDFEALADPDDAATIWQQTLERWPDAVLAWLGAGNVEIARGDTEAAIHSYRQLLTLEPTHGIGRFNLAVALERAGQPCEALSLLSSLVGHEFLGERAQQRRADLIRKCPGPE